MSSDPPERRLTSFAAVLAQRWSRRDLLATAAGSGLLAGALIPRSDKEKQALAPLGKRLAEGAGAALAAAKETGKEQLSASMISKDAARDGARRIFDSALQAAKGEKAA